MFWMFPPHAPNPCPCFGPVTLCKRSLGTLAASGPRCQNVDTGCQLELQAHNCPRCREPCLFQEEKLANGCSCGPVRVRGRTGGVRTPEVTHTWSSETARPGWRVSGGAGGGSGSGVAQKLQELNARPVRNYHLLHTSWTTCIHDLNCGIRPWHWRYSLPCCTRGSLSMSSSWTRAYCLYRTDQDRAVINRCSPCALTF